MKDLSRQTTTAASVPPPAAPPPPTHGIRRMRTMSFTSMAANSAAHPYSRKGPSPRDAAAATAGIAVPPTTTTAAVAPARVSRKVSLNSSASSAARAAAMSVPPVSSQNGTDVIVIDEDQEHVGVPQHMASVQLHEQPEVEIIDSDMAHSLDVVRERTILAAAATISVSTTSSATSSAPPKKKFPPLTEDQEALSQYNQILTSMEDEYREDILQHMLFMMDLTMPNRSAMEQQPDISLDMRPTLLDFLSDLHQVYKLQPETLFLAINILDRYSSKRVIHKKHYQLVGCTALWVAAKFEDSKDCVPTPFDLKTYCRDVYEESSFIQMERHVLTTLDWQMGHPTCEAWLKSMSTGIDTTRSYVAEKMVIRYKWQGMKQLDTIGIPYYSVTATGTFVARYLMEVMMYKEALLDVPACYIAEAALILSKAVNYGFRERELESEQAAVVAKHMDEWLTQDLTGISETVYKKYKEKRTLFASGIVGKYYLQKAGDSTYAVFDSLPESQVLQACGDLEELMRDNDMFTHSHFHAEDSEMEVEQPQKDNGIHTSDSGYYSATGEANPMYSPGKTGRPVEAPLVGGSPPRKPIRSVQPLEASPVIQPKEEEPEAPTRRRVLSTTNRKASVDTEC